MRIGIVLSLGLVVLGCGDDGSGPGDTTTSATQTSGDSTTSAGSMSGTSASSTSGTSAGSMSGTSASTTSGTSASSTSGTSAGPSSGASGSGGPDETPCGVETCDRATQLCLEGNFGGPTSISCVPIPDGCDGDRTCGCVADTVCTTGLAMCSEVSDNHVFCETGLD